MRVDKEVFNHLWRTEYKHSADATDTGSKWFHRGFKACFGLYDHEVAVVWERLDEPDIRELYELQCWRPKYLMDALFFLRVYSTEAATAVFCGRDEKTLRKWNWRIVKAIAYQDWVSFNVGCVRGSFSSILMTDIALCVHLQIDFSHRFLLDNGSYCLITLDGTDFRIQEPTPFDPKWYSHKFKAAGVRYEVGICIQTGQIVWVNGPYPCGEWSDLRIARDRILYELRENEWIVADGGYNDAGIFFKTPTGLNNEDQRMKGKARARHECVNRRFKQWQVLQQRFRHDVHLHGLCFHAIANLTHMEMDGCGMNQIETHEGPFGLIFYKDNWAFNDMLREGNFFG